MWLYLWFFFIGCAGWRAMKLKWSRGWSTSQHPQAATFFNPQGRCQGCQGFSNLVCRLVVSKRSWHQLTIFSSPNRDEAYTSLKLLGIWQAPTFCWQNNIASELQLFVKDMKATCKTYLFKSEIIQKKLLYLWIFEEVFKGVLKILWFLQGLL